uniref:Uncharacterized protein n=1 Tax=Pipistrellus kuhlii TaxID=59472 RepID=A0A7J7UTQ6_PIPKU|nr:hypothetical protein mPipKuh1_008678 [Pipistrellus kuhlii]
MAREQQPQFLLSFWTESSHPGHLPALPPTARVASRLPMRLPAPHATAHPASPSDGSALGSGPPRRASQPPLWLTPGSASSSPHSTSCGSGAPAPVSPPSCPRPAAGFSKWKGSAPSSSRHGPPE